MIKFDFTVSDDPYINLEKDDQVQAHFERETGLVVNQLDTNVHDLIRINFVTDFGAKRASQLYIISNGQLLGVEE